MHELSLANRLVTLVEESARGAGASRVTVVTLKIGQLSGVAVDALKFAYDVATADTLLAGSRLEAVILPVKVFCANCVREAELPNIQRFCCPFCDAPTADVRSGRELDIESIEVE